MKVIKRVICESTITNIDVIIQMKKFGIAPPIVGKTYHVIEEYFDTENDNAKLYILKEYAEEDNKGNVVCHSFQADMFADEDWEGALTKEIIGALKAPAPKGEQPRDKTWSQKENSQGVLISFGDSLDLEHDEQFHREWEQRLKDGFVLPHEHKPRVREFLSLFYINLGKARTKEEYDAGQRMITLLKRLLAT